MACQLPAACITYINPTTLLPTGRLLVLHPVSILQPCYLQAGCLCSNLYQPYDPVAYRQVAPALTYHNPMTLLPAGRFLLIYPTTTLQLHCLQAGCCYFDLSQPYEPVAYRQVASAITYHNPVAYRQVAFALTYINPMTLLPLAGYFSLWV